MSTGICTPTIIRCVHAECDLCGKETDYGVMIQIRRGKSVGPSKMSCAECRLHKQFRLDPTWNGGENHDGDYMSDDEFAAWCAENPPLEDDTDDV